jgi:hypothetical protein
MKEESDTDKLTRLRIEVVKGNMTLRREGDSLVFEPVPPPPASEERRRLPMAEEDHGRPQTRGECETARGLREDGEPNPCPWVSCFYHLALEVGPRGELRVVAPTSPDDAEDILFEAMAETCVLDVADREGWRILHGMNGGVSPATAASLLGMSAGRLDRIEHQAENKFAAGARRVGIAPEDEGRTFRPREAQLEREEDDDAEPTEEVAPKAPRVMRGTLFDATAEWQTAERSRAVKVPKKSEPKRETEPETTGTLALFGSEGEW